MRRFATLYAALDATTKTLAKQEALEAYFREAPAHDAAWATFFLTGRALKRLVRSRDLRDAALAAAALPEWLFEASYHATGDLAETITLLLPPPSHGDDRALSIWIEQELAPLAGLPPDDVKHRLVDAWSRLTAEERFVYLKLITGAFRVGVARQLVERALAAACDVGLADVAQRLVGDWTPSPEFFDVLRGTTPGSNPLLHRPYPFFLAHALDVEPSTLGRVEDWQAEWKWDGIRAQLVVRGGSASVWSRGEALVSEAFPEIDTNVLVRFLVRDHEAQFERARRWLKSEVVAAEGVMISLLVLLETEWVLRTAGWDAGKGHLRRDGREIARFRGRVSPVGRRLIARRCPPRGRAQLIDIMMIIV